MHALTVHSKYIATSVVFAAATAVALSQAGCTAAASAKAQENQKPPIHVDTAHAVGVDAPIVLHLTGSLKGMKMADLAANASGRVLRTYVEPGDEIKEGALVAQLDTSAAGLAMKQAHVDVLTQKTQEEINLTECARNEKLFATGTISSAEHDSVTAKCKTAPLVRASAEVS